jgi:hypothetical protein
MRPRLAPHRHVARKPTESLQADDPYLRGKSFARRGTRQDTEFAPATAQCRLSGVVRDGSGQPVAGGDVVLTPGPELAVTDRRGRYCFASLDDGRYEASASGVTASGVGRSGSSVDLSGAALRRDFVSTRTPPRALSLRAPGEGRTRSSGSVDRLSAHGENRQGDCSASP